MRGATAKRSKEWLPELREAQLRRKRLFLFDGDGRDEPAFFPAASFISVRTSRLPYVFALALIWTALRVQ